MQSELFFGCITALIVLIHLFYSFHWSSHIVKLLISREMEYRLSVLVKFADKRVTIVFKIEVSLLLLFKSLFEDHFVTLFEVAFVYIFSIKILIYDVRDVDFWQLLRNLLFHHFDEFIAISHAKVQVVFVVADPLAIADIASL